MREWLWLALFGFAIGCDGGGGGKDTDGGDTDESDDSEDDTDVNTVDVEAELEAIVAGLDKDACADNDTIPAEAVVANTYFIGIMARNGDDVNGDEIWVQYPDAELAATSDWQDLADGCSMIWRLEGTVSTEGLNGNCATCDVVVEVSAAFDGDASDCPQGLEDEEGVDYTAHYEVATSDDGSADWYFEGGNALGAGELGDDHVTYVSELNCKIY